MRKERILAIIMSMLMVLTMLPATVFAAEIPALDGKLKLQGIAADGRTLTAEFKEVKPEGLTDADVTYLWERKTVEDEEKEKAGEKPELKELGKEKSYTVTTEDIGSKIVLTIVGKEDMGYSGSLKVVSDTVVDAQTGAELETKAAQENTDTTQEEAPAENNSAEENSDDQAQQDAENEQSQSTEENTEESSQEPAQENTSVTTSENVETIPEATSDEEKQKEDSAGTESVEGIPEATEDGTYDQTGDTTGSDSTENTEAAGGEAVPETVISASVTVGDGSTDVVDFGTITSGEEDSVQAQYVTVTNTGNTSLNFSEISPEHFMVQDITDPMDQNSSQQLWIIPRPGIEAGTYDDVITYTSDEGATASFEAKITVEEPKTEEPETPSENTNGEGTESGATGVTLGVEDGVASGLNLKTMDSQTISVTNNSNQVMTITAALTGDSSTAALTISPAEQEVQPGASAAFTVTPVEGLTPDTPYLDNIRFADKDNDKNELIIPVNVTIPAPATSKVKADNTSVDFGTLVTGYTPEQRTVTLTNEGNADAVLSEAVSDKGTTQGQYFDIEWKAQTVAAGGATEFKIQPKADLPASQQQESFTITDSTNNTTIVITATVTIEEAKRNLALSTSELNFPTVKKGYSEIAAQQFTVTNNGNITETLEQPVTDKFNVSVNPENLTLAPGASAVYTVQPKTGADVGSYSETIKISSDKAVKVSLQVVKGNAVLTKVQQPSAVTGLPNGTKKDASSLKLPSTVVIETTEGSMKAAVAWDVKSCSYKQSSTDAQKFTVTGKVTLPSGVDNDNQISLAVSAEVSVNAYSAKIASAEQNKITGIEPNGVYTTQSKISFTAVGAGMDNASPKKGDTRYVPQSWTVINTNAWSAAPYTATFGLAQSGDYTLKVAFGQQQFDGSSWKATGTTDTRQVSFTITKAKITAPGTNLTQAANKKNAVKTGDNTPILPFVCILIAAVVVIAGVFLYKKKNKK